MEDFSRVTLSSVHALIQPSWASLYNYHQEKIRQDFRSHACWVWRHHRTDKYVWTNSPDSCYSKFPLATERKSFLMTASIFLIQPLEWDKNVDHELLYSKTFCVLHTQLMGTKKTIYFFFFIHFSFVVNKRRILRFSCMVEKLQYLRN